MAKALFGLNLSNKSVLDVGCGTGILSIIAKKLGAQHVIGIDIDEWSIENSRENRKANGYHKEAIDFYQGTINSIENDTFDVMLANINKNILLKEISKYAAHLNPGGTLLISGFFDNNCPELLQQQKKPTSKTQVKNLKTSGRFYPSKNKFYANAPQAYHTVLFLFLFLLRATLCRYY